MLNASNAIVTLLFLAFWGVGFVVFYHLTRFGVGVVPKRLSAIFLTGAVILFTVGVILYQRLDLTQLL